MLDTVTTTESSLLQRRRDAVRAVLQSVTFARASRLCSTLEYICEQTLAHKLNELTEQQIGIHVFERQPGYNSSEDTIVRNTVRLLRQRLEAYYREEGQADRIRISIPKGSYIANFTELEAKPLASEAVVDSVPPVAVSPETVQSPASRFPAVVPRPGWPVSAKIVVGVLIAVLAIVFFWFFVVMPKRTAVSASPDRGPEALWKLLFTPGRKTLIVPGDAALDIYSSMEQRYVPLWEYTDQSYLRSMPHEPPHPNGDLPIVVHSVTPMADLRLVANLVRVPTRMHIPDQNVEIRYARDVVVGDTRENNLILIGSSTFNPWETLYEPQMDFKLRWDVTDNSYSVLNTNPSPGEAASYLYNRNSQRHGALTVVSLLDNSQGSGKVLIVEGTSMGTIYAASTFLFNDSLWGPVIAKATDARGHLRNFQVLMLSDFVRGGVTNTRIAAIHVH